MRQKVIYSEHDGQAFVSYTFDDQPTIHVELNGAKANLSKKYQFAIKEVEMVKAYLGLILERYFEIISATDDMEPGQIVMVQEPTMQALFAAATVGYGKLFMGTGSGRKKFSAKDFFTGEGRRFEKLDSWWMDVRNNYIAHSASDLFDDARIVMLFFPNLGADRFCWCFPHVGYKQFPPVETIMDLNAMVEFVYNSLKKKQDSILDSIASHLTNQEKVRLRSQAIYASPLTDWPPSPPIDEL